MLIENYVLYYLVSLLVKIVIVLLIVRPVLITILGMLQKMGKILVNVCLGSNPIGLISVIRCVEAVSLE